MIRDRGKIKWTSLMLPEHVKELRDIWEEFERDTKPEVDIFALSEMEERIRYAMEYHLPLRMKIWNELKGKCETKTGTIHYLNERDRNLMLECGDEGFVRVRVEDLISVDVVE
ncbi:YolD-like family protein [Rossellomorea marisflavi]|uniref:YolD-like family protein n=1 Tax=Rossellomorea marisflavi TaxID=189381 RepID=UPI00203AB271|nr:YolD-like family protein [Rossellomorea marisflavi]MCM2588143.1 YolD-like family protein [Rossellomorea marisflavi]